MGNSLLILASIAEHKPCGNFSMAFSASSRVTVRFFFILLLVVLLLELLAASIVRSIFMAVSKRFEAATRTSLDLSLKPTAANAMAGCKRSAISSAALAVAAFFSIASIVSRQKSIASRLPSAHKVPTEEEFDEEVASSTNLFANCSKTTASPTATPQSEIKENAASLTNLLESPTCFAQSLNTNRPTFSTFSPHFNANCPASCNA
mmetsp:Transcript_87/g.312  ORF Transcript_87/g.312 Transcript_87/m.312 type:complete len:206 (-) Transcript_87:2202-2819(-)